MCRMLTAGLLPAISLMLCSCAQEVATAPAQPENEVSAVKPQPEPANKEREDSAETPEVRSQPVAESRQPTDPELAASPPGEPSTPPDSSNPVIDFFRSVDRGVKSSTPQTVPSSPSNNEERDE